MEQKGGRMRVKRKKKEMEEREGSWSKADAMNFSRRVWPVAGKNVNLHVNRER